MTRYSGNQIFNALAEGDHPDITDTTVFVRAEELPIAKGPKLYVGFVYAVDGENHPPIICFGFDEKEIRKKVDEAGPSCWMQVYVEEVK